MNTCPLERAEKGDGRSFRVAFLIAEKTRGFVYGFNDDVAV